MITKFMNPPRSRRRRSHWIIELISDLWTAFLPLGATSFVLLLCWEYATPLVSVGVR